MLSPLDDSLQRYFEPLTGLVARDAGDYDYSLPRFQHLAVWNGDEHWIEMRLRATEWHVVNLGVLDMDIEFAKGDEIRTEISTKFTRELIESEFEIAGLTLAGWWTDGDYALASAKMGA